MVVTKYRWVRRAYHVPVWISWSGIVASCSFSDFVSKSFRLSHTFLDPQDTQLLLWDLEMDEIVVPLRRPPGGSPTYSTGSQSAHWDNAIPMGTLQPAPCKRDVPKLSPVIAHRVHTEPLSGLMFTQESVVTACREGHIKIWTRPSASESQSNSSEANPAIALLSTSFPKDNKGSLSSKIGGSSLKS